MASATSAGGGASARAGRRLLAAAGFLLTATAVVYLYGALSRHWTPIGGTKGRFLHLEVPLFAFAAWLGHVRLPGSGRGRRLAGWLAACVPPLVLYALIDGGHAFLRRGLRWSDLAELPGLFRVSPALAAGVAALLLGACLVPLLRLALLARRAPPAALLSWAVPRAVAAVLLVAGCQTAPAPLRGYVAATVGDGNWSEQWTLRRCGRFAATLHFYVRRAIALERLPEAARAAPQGTLFAGALAGRPNVHLVVLESFLDPRLVSGVEFDRPPLHPDLRALLGEGGDAFDLVTAPVYGGGTAQTEFELLTGLPALGRVETIEFNALEGHAVPGLVRALRERGYRTVASVGTQPHFYNCGRAYRSLGFDETHFLDGASYLGSRPGEVLFDGDLLARNLEHVTARFLATGQPVFNYVVGMYGHHPYERDRQRRPDVCRLLPGGDGSSTIERIANQFHHRTGALAAFLSALRERDPTALVFVTSDHLPPLFDGGQYSYRHDLHRNVCLLFAAGERVRWTGEPTFHVPHALFARLCGRPAAIPDAAALEQRYLATIARGLGVAGR